MLLVPVYPKQLGHGCDMEDINKINNISTFDTPDENKVNTGLKQLEPNPLVRQSQLPEQTTYQGTQTGVGRSIYDAAKLDVVSGAQDIYNVGAWASQHILGNEPDHGGFNFGDKMELSKLNIASEHPNNLVMFGSNLIGMTAAAIILPEALGAARVAAASRIASGVGETVASTTAKEVAETSLLNKIDISKAISNPKGGLIRRLTTYSVPFLPFEVGSNINYDKQGKANIDTLGFLKDTAINTIPFGIGEGIGAIYRSTVMAESQVTSAGLKATELSDRFKKEDSLKTTERTPGTIEQDNINHDLRANETVENNKSNAVGNEELIDATFTKAQKEQIINNTLKPTIKTGKIHSDIRLSDDAIVEYNRIITSGLDDISKRKLTQAILSKYGVLHNSRTVSLADPTAQAELSTDINQLNKYYKESGARKVLLTDEYRKLPVNKQADKLAKGLFKTQSYLNSGAIKEVEKKGFYIDEPYKGGSEITHNYPNWYMETKRGTEDANLLKELDSMVASGSKHGAYLKSLQEASHKKYTDDYRKGLFNDIEDTMDNHMGMHESNQLLNDYRDGKGMFGARDFTENEKELSDMVMKSIESNEHKFYDDADQNVYFTKIIKKIRDNADAAESYFTCMIGGSL